MISQASFEWKEISEISLKNNLFFSRKHHVYDCFDLVQELAGNEAQLLDSHIFFGNSDAGDDDDDEKDDVEDGDDDVWGLILPWIGTWYVSF